MSLIKKVKMYLLSKIYIVLSLIAFAGIDSAMAMSEIELLLNWKPEPEFGGFYEAQYRGYFQNEGLKVKIIEGGAGTPTTQMVANGKVHFAIAGGEEIPLAIDRGADLVSLFAVYQKNPLGLMIRSSRKEITSIEKIWNSDGLLSIQIGLPFVSYFEKKFGKPKVKLVPYLGGIGTFLADPNFGQQCFVTAEPIDAEEKGVPTRSFLIADEGFNPYSTVLISQKKWISQNSKLTQKLLKAIKKGWESYLRDPSFTNQKMAALNTSMPLKTFERISKSQIPFIINNETRKNGLGSMTDENWRVLSNQLLELKLIRKARPGSDYFFKQSSFADSK